MTVYTFHIPESPKKLLAKRFKPTQKKLLLDLLRSGVPRSDIVSVLQEGTDEEWKAILESSKEVPPHRGAQVVLSGGSGSKRKWNGNHARITKYPRSGSWMTVRVVGEATVLTWRKGGFRKVSGEEASLVRLNKDLLTRVLSFLGGEEDPTGSGDDDNLRTIYVKDAGRLHTQIASVCRKLRQFCDDTLRNILGRVDANMFGLDRGEVVPCVLWMCRHKVRLGAFKIQAEVADIPMLCMLLRECDTASLTDVEARVGFPFRGEGTFSLSEVKNHSNFITQAWMAKFRDRLSGEQERDVKTIDLTRKGDYHPTLQRMAWDLEVPFEQTPSRKGLHDTIAEECPNLVILNVNCRLPPIDGSSYRSWRRAEFSDSLFSMPHLRNLRISFSFSETYAAMEITRFNCNFITSFVENLPRLEVLNVGSPTRQVLYGIRLHIESETLHHLNVERLGKGVWVSCKCPSLERYICNGAPYGNGTRPDLTDDQLNALQDSDVFPGTTTMIPEMEVPDSCVFELKDYGGFYSGQQDRVRNARYFVMNEDSSDDDE